MDFDDEQKPRECAARDDIDCDFMGPSFAEWVLISQEFSEQIGLVRAGRVEALGTARQLAQKLERINREQVDLSNSMSKPRPATALHRSSAAFAAGHESAGAPSQRSLLQRLVGLISCY